MISFQQFFAEKFEFDLYANLAWNKIFLEYEEQLSPYLIRSMSHIINVHHIWNARLMQKVAESNDWDILPVEFMERLHQENYRQTINFLEHDSLTEKINYHDSEGVPLEKETMDILYHQLTHSNYHRAQLAVAARELELPVANAHFILMR